MASTGHGQQDPQSSSDLLARVGVFVGLFGIGLSTLLATVAVQERLGPLWVTLLLTLAIALIIGGGAGGIYSLVAAGKKSAAGKSPLRTFRGTWTYSRTTAIAAGAATSVILAVSLLFIAGTSQARVTSTTLTMSPASPIALGNPVTLTATVTPAAAGTVQFKAWTTNIGTPVTVTNGTASVTTSTFAVRSYRLTAVFTPTDPALFGPSTSPAVTAVVTRTARPPRLAPTSTILGHLPASPVLQGTRAVLTAAVAPAAAGTVQFKDGTTNIGNPVTVTNGTASVTTSTFAVGSHQLTAVFTPTDPAAYGPSTSPAVPFVVTAPTGR